MSCNSCTKPFSLLRKEKGCPGCGFSYCSKCLDNKIFLSKLNNETKVCTKCKKNESKPNDLKPIEAPDAYYRRIGTMEENQAVKTNFNSNTGSIDQQILQRLEKLKEGRNLTQASTTEEDIKKRLLNIKGETPSASDAQLHARLAKLKGVPIDIVTSKPVLPLPDTRTEQEQANDLIKQYMAETNIDTKYQDEFEGLISDMESRMLKLKGTNPTPQGSSTIQDNHESEEEDETIKQIIEKVKTDAYLKDEIPVSNELPFCEICNEDARMRCLGCRYLFCKRCFLEHKDDDDGCNKYEPYTSSKDSVI